MKQEAEAEAPPPKPPAPRAEPMWRVYVNGRLRSIYSINNDTDDKPQALLQAWLGSC